MFNTKNSLILQNTPDRLACMLQANQVSDVKEKSGKIA